MRHQTGRHLPEGVYVARRHQSNRRVTLADALSWKAGGWIGKDGRWKRGKRHPRITRRGEEAEGWRKRVWKEKGRLFPGVAMPYLILDLTEAEDLVSNLRRICSSKMTRWHRLSVLSPSFRLHQNIES